MRLLAAGMAIALVLAAGEATVRLIPRRAGFVDTGVGERAASTLHLPDFRDRPPPGAKREGSFRLLAVGDSFPWGYGVYADDAWPRRLERRLAAARPGLDLELVNWSRPGWNTEQAWQSVRLRLDVLAPDLVLLGFTLNDCEPTNMKARDELIEVLRRRSPGAALSRALYAGSAFYRLFWDRFENRRQRRAFVAHYEGIYRGESWRHCREAMAAFGAAAAEREVPLLLVIFPVFDSQLDDSYSYRRLHNKMTSAAHQMGIEVLDLLGGFRGMDGRRLALTPYTDPHPSELAHRVAADLIEGYLMNRGLVPESTGADAPGSEKSDD